MRISPFIIIAVIAVIGVAVYLLQGDHAEPVTFAAPDTTMLPAQDMGPIAVAETVQGILETGATQLWTFEATAGQIITIRLSTVASSTVAILPPDAMFSLAQIAIDPETDTAEICSQPLDATGTYTLQLQSVPGGPGEASGPYLIRIEHLGAPGDPAPAAVAENITTTGGVMSVVRSPPCQAG